MNQKNQLKILEKPSARQGIRVGASACLLGQNVRHDGGHKLNTFVTKALAKYFELEPFCPELSAGLGVPRPSIIQKRVKGKIRVIGAQNSTLDITDSLKESAANAIQRMNYLSAYILKKGSPSCGMERVRVYNETEHPMHNGRGIFAEALERAYPTLPLEEEGRLCDPKLRENFVLRVFTYYHWQQLVLSGLSVHGLIDFHAKNKFSLLAHNESVYRQLGKRVANVNKLTLDVCAEKYIYDLMSAIKTPATRKRHTNVLMHIMGFLKATLTREDKKEFISLLDQYRTGEVPLIVPIRLLRHHLRNISAPYIMQQTYMQPYPDELMLRNHL